MTPVGRDTQVSLETCSHPLLISLASCRLRGSLSRSLGVCFRDWADQGPSAAVTTIDQVPVPSPGLEGGACLLGEGESRASAPLLVSVQ